jgi:hypothetical protein
MAADEAGRTGDENGFLGPRIHVESRPSESTSACEYAIILLKSRERMKDPAQNELGRDPGAGRPRDALAVSARAATRRKTEKGGWFSCCESV